ncbi:nitroreductase family deazaflavin-dependent oxidoreductase [Sphingobium sp. EM0848]|uniref:nitroreductase family deazaflavin-dependent oxidoreductase n=1 Tax=Sphingobium sp. EM0848 TaxID=2743473 RepID=UPI00159C3C1E|nr:nitroreductase family deazaflavin-dependent oxidoreductase [Sphingobium sp. EM0848]
MTILEKLPWIQAHIDLYKSDPEKAHYFQSPGTEEPKPSLLLTTIGRKSGEKRDVPLIYGRKDDRFVIIASLGGAPDHPVWFKNLQAHPEAEIQVGKDHLHVRARIAQGAERAELWEIMAAILPQYRDYAKATEGIREIPVVVLERG